jgi:hypothetical protein
MTLEQTQQALLAHGKDVRIRLVHEVLPAAPGTRFVSILWAGIFGDTSAGTGDEYFKLEFSNPPTQRLIVIWRKQTFPPRHELGMNSTAAAFREKYGQPRFTHNATPLTRWTWATGAAGQQPPGQSACGPQGTVALAMTPQEVIRPVLSVETRTYFNAPQCGTAVDVSVTGFNQLVDTIATMLIDFPAAQRAREEIEAMSRRPDTRPIEAEQRGRPKL